MTQGGEARKSFNEKENIVLKTVEAADAPAVRKYAGPLVSGVRLKNRRDAADGVSRELFDANPNINLLFSEEFLLIDCNPAAVAFFGCESKDELILLAGNDFDSLAPPYCPEGADFEIVFTEQLRRAVELGRASFETVLYPGGVPHPFSVLLKVIRYKNGYAVAAYFNDQKQAKEADATLARQEKLFGVVNSVAEKLMMSDTRTFKAAVADSMMLLGRSMGASRAYLWRNVEREGLLAGKQLCFWAAAGGSRFMEDDGEELVYDRAAPGWRAALGDTSELAELLEKMTALSHDSGGRTGGSVLVVPLIMGGEFWGFVGFNDYMQVRKFTRNELSIVTSGGLLIASAIRRNEMMIDLVHSRETALANTQAKSDFLSRMSHEIRTPMNAIIGMTTIAKKSQDPAKTDYCLSRIESASSQLLGLINDILDMSKIEANKLDITNNEFNLEKMIQSILNVVQVKMNEKKQEFLLECDQVFERNVIADELRLTQVITNLLSNAIKFTPECGKITLSMRFEDNRNGKTQLFVQIKDNGIGVTPEQKERLFTPYEQASAATTQKYGGTGLGLSICKKIVNLMGGEIDVDSVAGLGSVFKFYVDIAWGTPIRAESPGRLRRDLKVLVADPSKDGRAYFENILKGFNVGCETAENVENAMNMMREGIEKRKPYDIIFIDWLMLCKNGAESVGNFGAAAGKSAVVGLMSSAEESAEQPDGVRFVYKPVMPSTILDVVAELSNGSAVTESEASFVEKNVNWSGKNLLLFEDIEINKEIIVSVLEDTGISIDWARNGLEGVALYKENPDKYDVVLMDIQMPELDGMESTRRIRRSGFDSAGSLPIIAMTASAFKEDIDRCLSAGMDDHLAKPVDVDRLYEKLGLYLG